ncbi:22789_t:CDS:2 [Cetraspora pellucida]|uniref:22789_t:CDS:1 n=1 Tax=Cetraspora pellucida TaxID=1433469 RepID=A0A9N9GQ57_9GLOM|nr:22789_t:CDS:2 [Cetraspora pellucida]
MLNASTIKLKSTFFSNALDGFVWVIDCDSQEVVWSQSNLQFTSDQPECLVFSTSVSLSKYCLHFHIYKISKDEDNIDNSQDTCWELDGSEFNWQLSSIDCGQIPSDIKPSLSGKQNVKITRLKLQTFRAKHEMA